MREPECGTDFCVECGDCLVCYDDECIEEGTVHTWPEGLNQVYLKFQKAL